MENSYSIFAGDRYEFEVERSSEGHFWMTYTTMHDRYFRSFHGGGFRLFEGGMRITEHNDPVLMAHLQAARNAHMDALVSGG